MPISKHRRVYVERVEATEKINFEFMVHMMIKLIQELILQRGGGVSDKRKK